MTRIYKQDNLLEERRFMWASLIVVSVIAVMAMRIWYLQIYKGDYYKIVSENNRIRRIEIPAPRGLIFDRFGELVLGNRPFFDLVYIPQYSLEREKTFKVLSKLLHVPDASFERRYKAARGGPKFMPINLKRNLSVHEVSLIETNKVFLPGVDIIVAPRRDYNESTPSHLVGYLGEIDRSKLKTFNEKNDANPYLAGDLIGKQGLESRWEEYLRGKRGFRFIQVNAYGRQGTNSEFKLVDLPEVPAVQGSNLMLTIDYELQKITADAFRGKTGAVIAMDPHSGEILSIVSEPGFDPTMYQNGLSREEWRSLITNPFNPLLDKTTGGEFPPGSLYKALVAIAALEEKVITPYTTHFCPGSYKLGNHTFHCHKRESEGGHGWMNVKTAITQSCDVFFYQTGIELGVDRIAKYAKMFMMGERLGLNINFEQKGLVPTSQWKQETYGTPWNPGETPLIAIGQGYNKFTPLQMVSLFSTIANGGKVWKPHIVKNIVNHLGQTIIDNKPEMLSDITPNIKPANFKIVRQALQAVVEDEKGTGKKAQVENYTVAGKTGSVQVVSLRKTQTRQGYSVKWREHALFAAFSPVDGAEIVLVVVSENDAISGGGMSAAPVAQKIIQGYWDLKEKRKMAQMSQNEAAKNVRPN